MGVSRQVHSSEIIVHRLDRYTDRELWSEGKSPADLNQTMRPFAVITGASRGIGAEYARRLSVRGFDLLLVSRDETRLKALKTELLNVHPIEVETETLDLAQPNAGHELYVSVRKRRESVDLLINNAGFGMYGDFATMALPRIQEMLRLHVNTVVDSTRLFLPSMIERQSGAIINVSSVAGFFPIPYMTEYAATKAFLVAFSEALAEEVRASGVCVQACCPGYTDTDFHRSAGVKPRNPLKAQTVQEVVDASLKGLDKGRTRVTVGWQGWLLDMLIRYTPRTMLIRMAGNRTNPERKRKP